MWNSLSGLLASYMLNSLWAVAAIGGAGWLASLLLKRLGPSAQHVAWVATLALAVLAPALPLARSMFVARSASTMAPHISVALSSTTPTGDLVSSGSFALPQALILAFSVFLSRRIFLFRNPICTVALFHGGTA